MTTLALHGLAQLARLYGVQTSYFDIAGQRQTAAVDPLLDVLRALGAPVARLEDVAGAITERRRSLWQRAIEPVIVAWDGAATLVVRQTGALADRPLDAHLALEDGTSKEWRWVAGDYPPRGQAVVAGTHYLARRVPLAAPLPPGYHRLTVETAGRVCTATVIAASPLAYRPPPDVLAPRTWGIFCPLYALRTARDWGCGDFTDLQALLDWVAEQGGEVLATLPLLAAYLETPFDPSPYSPASRLFWNELFVDPTRAPELAESAEARSLLESAALQAEVAELRDVSQVDYRHLAALKRPLLATLAARFFAAQRDREPAFQAFLDSQPLAPDYAAFRATVERRGESWHTWPERLAAGELRPGDYEPAAREYHLYVQWLAERQLQALSEHGRARGVQLYLDLPLGVHPDGYDVWREREAFVHGVSAGAPPDAFFTGGQDWGFAPLHPEQSRTQGYRYFRACVQHHLRHAGLLRVDHVMGLHRLFWIPHGRPCREGVYVRYRHEELYAVLALESHRHEAGIVGEDLGIVPEAVRAAMARHEVRRMYVLEYELDPHASPPLRPVSEGAVASLNTHDMPPWAAFWEGLDLLDNQALGLLDPTSAVHERARRNATVGSLVRFLQERGELRAPASALAALHASLAQLGASAASVVLVPLEDLWLEPLPQNVPGTWRERPNWRRKARFGLEELRRLTEVVEPLRALAAQRTRERGPA